MVRWRPLWVYFIGEYPALPSAVFWGVLLMLKNLDFGLFWLQHASTRQGWYILPPSVPRVCHTLENP